MRKCKRRREDAMSSKRAASHTRFLGICACTFSNLLAAPAWSATLVGYWNLDEGTGSTAADSSGSGNTGTLVNSPSWVPGRIGNALNFVSGTKAYVAASGTGSLANLYTHGMTVTAWIKPRSAGGGYGRIVDKDNNNGGWFFAMYGSTRVRFAVDEFPTLQPSRTSTASISSNTWQHVAATWDGSITGANIHIYVNGVLADGTTLDGTGAAQNDSDTPLAIGNRTVDLARGFDGVIDEVRIYSGILTLAEIQALAAVQGPTAPAGLTATRPSGTQVNLNWSASSDSTGVTDYLIERCSGVNCSNFTQVATTAGTTYSNTGLSGSTSYSYRVRATDAANNLSPYSGVATAASFTGTGGAQPPTVPSDLSATSITTSGLTLSWTASTPSPGGTGVTGYFVYRNGNTVTPIATVKSGTSFTDSGLTSATTYSYQVAAFDGASPANVSAPSAALSVTTLKASPAAWSGGDIGSVAAAGSSTVSGGTFTIKGSGVDIWGTADSFQFESQPFTGNGSISARVVSQTNTNVWAKAGVMFRATLAAASSFAAVVVSAGSGSLIEARTGTGAAAVGIRGPAVKAPYWVRLIRSGNLLTGYVSADGKTWTAIGNYTVPMASQVHVGLAVTSHANGVLNTAVFDNVVISTAPQVSVAPRFAALTLGASQQFTATVTNTSNTAVTWHVNGVTGGSATTGTIDTTGRYTAPAKLTASPTSYTIAAVSVQDTTVSASAQAIVSNPGAAVDVATYKNDLVRSGLNPHETTLTPANVRSATFGLLRVLPGDGPVYAQPLYLSMLNVAGIAHNVVFVATEHNSVYAYDADTGAKLWQSTLTPTGETTSDARSCDLISPEIGVTATPVIDRTAGPHGTIYLVAMTKDSSGGYHQRIHALDVTTGRELFNGPAEIQATYPITGGGTTTFDPGAYKDRAGLLLLHGEIYTTWASHCDNTPYGGWIIAYDGTTLVRSRILNVAPNSNNLGPAIWMSGGAPAADSDSNIYLLTANGVFETTLDSNGFPNGQDYGNSFLKISTANNTLAVVDYFTMWNEISESTADLDLGSGGAMLLPDLVDASGMTRHLAVGAGKDGNIYVVNRDSMGRFNPSKNNIWQELNGAASQMVLSTPAYFNGRVYISERDAGVKAFTVTDAKLSSSPTSQTSTDFGYPGTIPAVSSNGSANGILWAPHTTNVLHAYDATNLGTELYNSNQAANGRDSFGAVNKYTAPTIAGGKVFVGTHAGVAVFGLLQ
jgi:hypothetical protein